MRFTSELPHHAEVLIHRKLSSSMAFHVQPPLWTRLFLVAWMIVFNGDHVTGSIQSYVYKQKTICGVAQRMEHGCLKLASRSKTSKIQCVSRCQGDAAGCFGVVVNQEGGCYLHYDCSGLDTSVTCAAGDSKYTSFERPREEKAVNPCQNGGRWDEATSRCACQPYSTGILCEDVLASCADLWAMGFPLGVHVTDMKVMGSPKVSKVRCEIRSDKILTYISHSDGNANYNSSFQDYKDGFYRSHNEFWLGLDNLHRLTQAGVSDLAIDLRINGVSIEKFYHGFEVDDEDDDYEIEYTSWTPVINSLGLSIGRCLKHGMEFSTWDRDNDKDSHVNMAAVTGSGWWYDTIHDNFCNLNGKKPINNLNRLDNVKIEWIDLSFGKYGKGFEESTLYLYERVR